MADETETPFGAMDDLPRAAEHHEREDDSGVHTAGELEAVFDIPVKVSAVLGRARMEVNNLLKLGEGSIVELDRKVGHFRRYSKRELTDVVTSAGFRIESCRYFDVMGIIPWYVAFVLLKQTTTGTNVTLYDRIVVPVMRRIENVVTPPSETMSQRMCGPSRLSVCSMVTGWM